MILFVFLFFRITSSFYAFAEESDLLRKAIWQELASGKITRDEEYPFSIQKIWARISEGETLEAIFEEIRQLQDTTQLLTKSPEIAYAVFSSPNRKETLLNLLSARACDQPGLLKNESYCHLFAVLSDLVLNPENCETAIDMNKELIKEINVQNETTEQIKKNIGILIDIFYASFHPRNEIEIYMLTHLAQILLPDAISKVLSKLPTPIDEYVLKTTLISIINHEISLQSEKIHQVFDSGISQFGYANLSPKIRDKVPNLSNQVDP